MLSVLDRLCLCECMCVHGVFTVCLEWSCYRVPTHSVLCVRNDGDHMCVECVGRLCLCECMCVHGVFTVCLNWSCYRVPTHSVLCVRTDVTKKD